jgi:hypothetical protein
MGRPKNTVRNVRVEAHMPEPLVAKIYATMWSNAEDRVPHGLLSKFMIQASEMLLAHLQEEKENVKAANHNV